MTCDEPCPIGGSPCTSAKGHVDDHTVTLDNGVRVEWHLSRDGTENAVFNVRVVLPQPLKFIPLQLVTVDEKKPEKGDPQLGCNRHVDCYLADARARSVGLHSAEHCHSEGCEDCHGR